jgi:translation initiation factor 4A
MSESVKVENWDDLNINEDILRGIYRYGFEKPTPIQSLAIGPIIEGKDLIGQAQSGTGKTGSFTIGSLQKIDISKNAIQVLILAPTRELVKQITDVVSNISSAMENLIVRSCIGGTSVNEDIQYFKKKQPHMIVGTAGRVFDMIKKGYLKTDNIKIIVMDEADEMLSKGFKNQIYDIFQFLPKTMQVALFSATMPYDVLTLTEKFMKEPIKIIMRPEELTLDCIQQYYIAIGNDQQKYETLKDLFSMLEVKQSIIYVNTISRVNELYEAMSKEDYPVCYIHSSMDKSQREEALKQFRLGQYRVLISSGITARGIDIQQVSIVINFDITRDINTYLHAIGRSGRYGRKGLAINFVTKFDIDQMKRIERHYKIDIKELPSNINELI